MFVTAGHCFAASQSPLVSHGVSLFGDLKYPSNFHHFDYVNKDAPKGGTIKLASIGTYDNLNPYILKGVAAAGIELIFDTLTVSAADESSTGYGLLAETIERDPNGWWVIFNLRDIARWHDGTSITADDVVFTFNTLKEKGHPHYRAYYRDIESAEKLSRLRVKFSFADNTNRELALIIGQLPILQKKYYDTHEFDKTTLVSPIGSGPYRLKSLDAGRSITYERDTNYWAKDLPINRGRYNFDVIHIDYYRDATVAIEALKAGEYDFRRENISKNWKKAYEIPHINDGRMVKEELSDGVPTGMQSFIFNIRRDNFKHPKFREALNYAYDFEWANKQLFYSAYARNTSFFGNSEFASHGLPNEVELDLLTPYKDNIPERVFTDSFDPPSTDGNGNARTNLIKARDLIKEAGFFLRDMKLINPETDQPVVIEFLLTSPSFERVVAPFIRNLNKLGIESVIRTVDSSQYIKRREEFDFDIMVHWFTQGPTPGNEQINYWHSSKADVNGSLNLIGIKNPAVDAMVEHLVKASDKDALIAATRALDRILLWNFYVIPQWHSRTHRVIYWNKFGRPEKTPPFSLGLLDTWWYDENKANQLQKRITKE